MAKTPTVTVVVVIVCSGLLACASRCVRPHRRRWGLKSAIELEIRDGTMSPAEVALGEGALVTLGITADRPVELHLYGYDLEEEVTPGEPAELSFDPGITGRFGIEDHDTETELGALIVKPREGG